MQRIKIRRALLSDLQEILQVFVDTIVHTAAKDYSPEQLSSWSASAGNEVLWKRRLIEQYFIVAEVQGQIGGFASLAENNYIELMYVHKNFLRKGIAAKMYAELEKEALIRNSNTILTDASKTARPFFETLGFIAVKENKNVIRGVEIINYRMNKQV